jgi:hypothetical protein
MVDLSITFKERLKVKKETIQETENWEVVAAETIDRETQTAHGRDPWFRRYSKMDIPTYNGTEDLLGGG